MHLCVAIATGGDERDRTDDPLLAKQVLSQLSYTPGLSGAAFPPFSFTLEVSFGAFKIKQQSTNRTFP